MVVKGRRDVCKIISLCSLEASLRTSNLRKLILYEPPIHIDVEINSPSDALDRMNSYFHIGEREKALLIFLQEIVGIPQNEINLLNDYPLEGGSRSLHKNKN